MINHWISKRFPNKSKLSTQTNIEISNNNFEENLSKCKTFEIKFEKLETILFEIEDSKLNLDRAVDQREEHKISTLVDENYKQLKRHLDSINEELKTMENNLEAKVDDLDPKETEIIKTKITSYYIELKNKVTRAHTTYNQFKKKAKNRLARQVKNIDTKNEYNDEQLDKIIDEDPNIIQTMVKQQVFGKASAQLQNAARDILEKCEGIKTLQKHVMELMSILQQISQIVSLQGEQINSIASHCENAKIHMVTAEKNLVQAKKHSKSVQKVL